MKYLKHVGFVFASLFAAKAISVIWQAAATNLVLGGTMTVSDAVVGGFVLFVATFMGTYAVLVAIFRTSTITRS